MGASAVCNSTSRVEDQRSRETSLLESSGDGVLSCHQSHFPRLPEMPLGKKGAALEERAAGGVVTGTEVM